MKKSKTGLCVFRRAHAVFYSFIAGFFFKKKGLFDYLFILMGVKLVRHLAHESDSARFVDTFVDDDTLAGSSTCCHRAVGTEDVAASVSTRMLRIFQYDLCWGVHSLQCCFALSTLLLWCYVLFLRYYFAQPFAGTSAWRTLDPAILGAAYLSCAVASLVATFGIAVLVAYYNQSTSPLETITFSTERISDAKCVPVRPVVLLMFGRQATFFAANVFVVLWPLLVIPCFVLLMVLLDCTDRYHGELPLKLKQIAGDYEVLYWVCAIAAMMWVLVVPWARYHQWAQLYFSSRFV